MLNIEELFKSKCCFIDNNGLMTTNLLHIEKIRMLDLSNIEFEEIPENINLFSNLEILVLGNHKITGENLNSLKHIKNKELLKEIYIKNIPLINIDFLQNFKNLEKIVASNNEIENIYFLNNMENLKYIYLGNNKITKIEGLNNLLKLNTLDLSKNKINTIENLNDNLKGKTYIKNLKLKDNPLKYNTYKRNIFYKVDIEKERLKDYYKNYLIKLSNNSIELQNGKNLNNKRNNEINFGF